MCNCEYTFSDFVSSPAGQILIILVSVFLMYLSLRLADLRAKKLEISADKRMRRYNCYNEFMDAMLKRQIDLNSKEFHNEFCRTYNRLSIIASPEISKLLDNAPSGQTTMNDLIKAMRKDIYEEDKKINKGIGTTLFIKPN
jgi:hypothetical protein